MQKGEQSVSLSLLVHNLLCEKYLQRQQSLYHVFVDFKKAFDRVWHAALWATMGLYNINDNLIRTIECLYNKALEKDVCSPPSSSTSS